MAVPTSAQSSIRTNFRQFPQANVEAAWRAADISGCVSVPGNSLDVTVVTAETEPNGWPVPRLGA